SDVPMSGRVTEVAIGRLERAAVMMLVTMALRQAGETSGAVGIGLEPRDNVHKWPPGPYGWELVRVADEDQPLDLIEVDGTEQRAHEVHGDHRCFVDNHSGRACL